MLDFPYMYNEEYIKEAKQSPFFKMPEIPELTDINQRIWIVYNLVRYFTDNNKYILEIGAVLPHYYKINHIVVDKDEVMDGVTNEEILTYTPKEKFDLIVSISTFEHIGFNEYSIDEEKYPNKVIEVIKHLKQDCLNDGGTIIITIPIGYNKTFDEHMINGDLDLGERYCLKRTSLTEWVESTFDEVIKTKCSNPYPCANGIVIFLYRK